MHVPRIISRLIVWSTLTERQTLNRIGGVLAVALLFLGQGTASAQGTNVELNYASQRAFKIPFQVDPNDRRIQQVQLHVSEDQGSTWNQYASLSPVDQRFFHFQTSHDGVFWFGVRTVDRDGKAYPANMAQLQPSLKIIVDTQPPAVNLKPLAAGGASVGVEWQVADQNLDLSTLKLDYRPTGAMEWQPLTVEQSAQGKRLWNPATNAPLQVRLRVLDKAGNPGEGTTTVAVGANAGAPATNDTYGSGTTSPAGGNVRIVNSTRISLNYELKDVGPSKVSVVELWYTEDGRNWQKYSEEKLSAEVRTPSTYVVNVKGEGIYGFTLLARSGVGLGDPPPKVGDAPQIWVEVDLTKPVVQLKGIEVGRGPDSGNLTISWSASDKNFGRQPISLFYSQAADGLWQSIAANLENNGRFVWRMPPGVPYQFHVKVEAADKAGNVGSSQTQEMVKVDLSLPKVQVLGVEPAK
jgi:hypothetical protein